MTICYLALNKIVQLGKKQILLYVTVLEFLQKFEWRNGPTKFNYKTGSKDCCYLCSFASTLFHDRCVQVSFSCGPWILEKGWNWKVQLNICSSELPWLTWVPSGRSKRVLFNHFWHSHFQLGWKKAIIDAEREFCFGRGKERSGRKTVSDFPDPPVFSLAYPVTVLPHTPPLGPPGPPPFLSLSFSLLLFPFPWPPN